MKFLHLKKVMDAILTASITHGEVAILF